MKDAYRPRRELATVRGIACVALVAYHVVGPSSAAGMHLPDSSYWHAVMNSLDFLRMPMFAVLAGFIYARRRVDPGSLLEFIHRKGLRLVAPLLFVTAVMVMLRRAVYGDHTTYAHALLYHYEHLWFLQSVFLIFVIFAIWDAFARPTWVELCIAAFGAVMISRTFAVTSFLSLNGVLYLTPFFAVGMALKAEDKILQSRDVSALASAIVSIVMLTYLSATIAGGAPITRQSLPAALCGLTAAYLMFVKCPRIQLFELIGRYSFTIYLWHSIAAAAARHMIERSAGLPVSAEFALLLMVGVLVPILIHVLVERIPGLCTAAAGLQWDQRPRTARAHSNLAAGQALALAEGQTMLNQATIRPRPCHEPDERLAA